MFSLLIIGNEILSGSVQDTNLAYMLKRFRQLSMVVDEVRIIPDEMSALTSAILTLKEKSQLLISSGGIGPTHDDITLQAYARVFQVDLVENDEMRERVMAYFGDDFQPGHRHLFKVPSNTELIGGGPDQWPVYKVENCFILPGLPEIFVRKFEQILQYVPSQPMIHRRALGVSVTEGFFAEELEELQRAFPQVEIGSYPNYLGSWDQGNSSQKLAVKLTFQSIDQAVVEKCFTILKERFISRNWVFPLGDG